MTESCKKTPMTDFLRYLEVPMPQTVEEWLGKDNELGAQIWKRKYQYQNETFPEWVYRVSGGNADVAKLIIQKKFLFGGRILSNRGVKDGSCGLNCFTAGTLPDDYNAIMDTLKDVGLTLKAQGGQGISLSALRPKGSPVGERYQSDGIVPFMKMFNSVTDGTANGGSRRGALMMELNAKHKDAMEFITIKQNTDQINAANLSIVLDDEFMEAVETYYETGEVVTLHMKKDYSGHIVEWDVVPIDVFKALAYNAWEHAEPGCLFDGETQKYTMLEHYNELKPLTHNPCGEQVLPANGACCLGSINLEAFVKNPFTKEANFDWDEFICAVAITTEALDDVLEENIGILPLKEQNEMAKNYRNIGLGITGYSSMLIKLNMRYGSDEANGFTHMVMGTMIEEAFMTSSINASRKEPFPKYDNRITDSFFVKANIPYKLVDLAKTDGLRNCSLLTVAPTGSLSLLLDVSSGIEPTFAFSHQRKVIGDANNEDKVVTIHSRVAREYMEATGNTELPSDIFIEAADIPWEERIITQGIVQIYVDTGISSTVNLPNETTVEDIEQLYLMAWKEGLKGVTVYRAGCAREGILTTGDTKTKEETGQETVQDNTEDVPVPVLSRGDIIQHSDNNILKIRALQTGCGKVYVHAHFDPDTGNLIEVFLDRGGSGGCERYMNGLSRMTSLAARAGVATEALIDQLLSVSQCAAYISRRIKHGDASKGICCPGAIGYAIQEMWDEVKDELFDDYEDEAPRVILGVPQKKPTVEQMPNHNYDVGRKDTDPHFELLKTSIQEAIEIKNKPRQKDGKRCPECGENSLTSDGGCNVCRSCGYSKCD